MGILNWLRRNLLYTRDEDYFPDCQLFLDDRDLLGERREAEGRGRGDGEEETLHRRGAKEAAGGRGGKSAVVS